MNTDPINIDRELVPEGWFLYTGEHLVITARSARVPFRKAVRNPPPPNQNNLAHVLSAGILIQACDIARFDAALAKITAQGDERAREKAKLAESAAKLGLKLVEANQQ